MKTSKPKAAPKTKKAVESKTAPAKKSSVATKSSGKKKTPPVKIHPGEEAIREKAREIYFERIARGEHGTPEDDWREAEELLMGS
jgi:hypothetical protein